MTTPIASEFEVGDLVIDIDRDQDPDLVRVFRINQEGGEAIYATLAELRGLVAAAELLLQARGEA